MTTKLSISIEYMSRELSEKSRDVRGWISSYASRNKISSAVEYIEMGTFKSQIEPYLLLTFKSKIQKRIFVQNGNKEFPYFEFL